MLRTHGLGNTKLYHVWFSMIKRCSNVNDKRYKNYGGRNITVCEDWINSFESFYNFCISNGYEDGLQIDRINNDGNYEPNNCRFVTISENCAIGKRSKQSNNTTGYVGISFNKEKNKFSSKITINNKRVHLGYFNLKRDALEARIDAEKNHLGKQLTNLNIED